MKIVVEGVALSRVTNALYGFHKEVGTRCNRAPKKVLYFIIHYWRKYFSVIASFLAMTMGVEACYEKYSNLLALTVAASAKRSGVIERTAGGKGIIKTNRAAPNLQFRQNCSIFQNLLM